MHFSAWLRMLPPLDYVLGIEKDGVNILEFNLCEKCPFYVAGECSLSGSGEPLQSSCDLPDEHEKDERLSLPQPDAKHVAQRSKVSRR